MKIFLDTETHDLRNPRLVELAYMQEGGEMVTFRCNPGVKIALDATVVNGIRDKDVASLPAFKDMPCYSKVKKLLEENTVVAHNASFDVSVLANEGIIVNNFICTKELAQTKWPDAPRHRLQHLRYWLNLDGDNENVPIAHTASGDVTVLIALWDAIHKNLEIDTYRADEIISNEPPPSQSPQHVVRSSSSENFDPSPSRIRRVQLHKRSVGRK